MRRHCRGSCDRGWCHPRHRVPARSDFSKRHSRRATTSRRRRNVQQFLGLSSGSTHASARARASSTRRGGAHPPRPRPAKRADWPKRATRLMRTNRASSLGSTSRRDERVHHHRPSLHQAVRGGSPPGLSADGLEAARHRSGQERCPGQHHRLPEGRQGQRLDQGTARQSAGHEHRPHAGRMPVAGLLCR